MGSSVKVLCSACSYATEIFTGGGMLDFETNCGFPALCTRCRTVVEGNHKEARLSCPGCGDDVTSYDDLSPTSEAGGGPVMTEWLGYEDEDDEDDSELTLASGAYPCPRCHAPQLRFTASGILFD
jgi:hypothetical protein